METVNAECDAPATSAADAAVSQAPDSEERARIEAAASAAQAAVEKMETREMAMDVWIDIARGAKEQAATDAQVETESVHHNGTSEEEAAAKAEEAPAKSVDGVPVAASARDGKKKAKKKPPRTASPLVPDSARPGSATKNNATSKKTVSGRAELPLSSSRGDRFRATGSGNRTHASKNQAPKATRAKLAPLTELSETPEEEAAAR